MKKGVVFMITKKESRSTQEIVIENIKLYIKNEGLKKDRLAKKMGMTPQNFYEYLKKERKNTLDFASKLSEILGRDLKFFMDQNFQITSDVETLRATAFSSGETLSQEGQEGFEQLLRICNLIEIYGVGEEESNA